MSDTYNPLEKQYEQTRGALKLISKYNFGVSIDTKSDLILREFKKMSGQFVAVGLVKITFPVEEIYTIELGR